MLLDALRKEKINSFYTSSFSRRVIIPWELSHLDATTFFVEIWYHCSFHHLDLAEKILLYENHNRLSKSVCHFIQKEANWCTVYTSLCRPRGLVTSLSKSFTFKKRVTPHLDLIPCKNMTWFKSALCMFPSAQPFNYSFDLSHSWKQFWTSD